MKFRFLPFLKSLDSNFADFKECDLNWELFQGFKEKLLGHLTRQSRAVLIKQPHSNEGGAISSHQLLLENLPFPNRFFKDLISVSSLRTKVSKHRYQLLRAFLLQGVQYFQLLQEPIQNPLCLLSFQIPRQCSIPQKCS